jgi:hypothetical protein
MGTEEDILITLPRAKELDTLWDKSVNESIKAGDGLARYRYAEQVAAAEREACAKLADEFYREGMDYDIGAAIRARKQKVPK